MTIPDIPTVFLSVPHPHPIYPPSTSTNNPPSKPSASLADPYPAPTIIPKHTVASDSADYESELAVVIGKEAKNVSEADALDYVLGYTACNDISSRASQFAQSQWCYSKGFDGACPIGPVLVSKKLVPRVGDLRLRGLKNGKVVQDSGLTCVFLSFLSVSSALDALANNPPPRPGTSSSRSSRSSASSRRAPPCPRAPSSSRAPPQASASPTSPRSCCTTATSLSSRSSPTLAAWSMCCRTRNECILSRLGG